MPLETMNMGKVGKKERRMSRRLTIEEVKEYAKHRGGKYLSDVYVNNFSKLKWECEKKHTWKAPLNRLKTKKSWCPKCAREAKRLTIEEMKKIAKSRDVECLSNVYIVNGNLKWKCNVCGSMWEATPCDTKWGKWCPKCAECKKHTIEEMKEIALKRDGKCLSKIYKNANSRLKWKCNVCNKIWYASPNNVIKGTWCPRCTKHEKLTIEEMKKLAKSKDGECLSDIYVNIDTDLLWKCNKCGEIWSACPDNIKQGTWCPKCAGTKKKSLEEIQELAKIRGGKCLSKEYLGSDENHLCQKQRNNTKIIFQIKRNVEKIQVLKQSKMAKLLLQDEYRKYVF